jgi:hypothetical protein
MCKHEGPEADPKGEGNDMSQQTTSRDRPPFRGSPLARRISSVILAAFIAVYLLMITSALSDRLRSPKGVIELIVLWLLGLIALGMLSRAWRKPV